MLLPPTSLVALLQEVAAGAVAFETLARPLAVAAGLALGVERLLELLKNVTDLFPGSGTPTRPGHRPGALARAEEELRAFHETQALRDRAEEARALRTRMDRGEPLTPQERQRLEQTETLLEDGEPLPALELDEAFPPGTIVLQPATDADDGGALRALTLQLVAAAAGILAAHLFDVRLFEALAPGAMPGGVGTDYLLTGLLIGGGSGPVHLLIRFIGQRKVSAPAELDRDEEPERPSLVVRPVTAEEAALLPPGAAAPGTGSATSPGAASGAGAGAAVATVADPTTAWVEIPYEGGVDRDRLASVHVRRRDPDTIIYHHTAMRRSSTFEDVVRVIKDRRDSRGNPWITGYNCVVTEDGVVHPFCRWDRYGNHAAGWNARSLGIAVNGNFESDPNVPWSNPDGRYGPVEPSTGQLDSAARVVALWTLIYDIPLDFDERIIPHKNVSPKTCPGSDFPYDRFREQVTRYHEAWKEGPDRALVDAFDQRHHSLLHV